MDSNNVPQAPQCFASLPNQLPLGFNSTFGAVLSAATAPPAVGTAGTSVGISCRRRHHGVPVREQSVEQEDTQEVEVLCALLVRIGAQRLTIKSSSFVCSTCNPSITGPVPSSAIASARCGDCAVSMLDVAAQRAHLVPRPQTENVPSCSTV